MIVAARRLVGRSPSRRLGAVALACLLAGCGEAATSASSPDVVERAETGRSDADATPMGPDGFELVFHDDFGGPAGASTDDEPLASHWSTCYWWQVDGGCTIASNEEQQWYRPEGVNVADGVATLTAEEIVQPTTDGSTLPVRSGMISTGHVDNDVDEPGFAFTYGYVEARVRFPSAGGTWPAVWLLSADRTSLPEIDVMEWYSSRPGLVTAHVHQRVDGERMSARLSLDVDDAAGAWHTVAADWRPGRVEFFFDGVSMGVVDDPSLVPDTPMYVIVNLALGGRAGDVDPDALPQTFEVDWIRVWQ